MSEFPTQTELLGTKLGDRPQHVPGLAPVSHALSDIQAQVHELESKAGSLDQIRATLLLNFDTSHRTGFNFGVTVDNSQSTMSMLLTVLTYAYQGRGTPVGNTGGQ